MWGEQFLLPLAPIVEAFMVRGGGAVVFVGSVTKKAPAEM